LGYANAMRTLAITAVLFIHVQVWFFRWVPRFGAEWWAASIINIANRWCVPVIFMLSGALLLDPNRQEKYTIFYKKRLKRIGLPILFWSIFYLIWRSVLLNEPSLRPKVILSNLVFGKPSYHLWFLYALFLIYLFTPILCSFWFKVGKREKWALALFFLCISSLSAILWTYSGDMGWRIPPKPIITAEWIYYLGYFMLGSLLRDVQPKRGKILLYSFLSIVIVVVNSIGYYGLSSIEQEYRAQGLFHSFLSPLVVLLSVLMFLIIKFAFSDNRNQLARFINSPVLGSATFGVYLIHIAVIDLFSHVVKWNKFVGTDIRSFILLLISITLTSYALVIVLRRISFMKRILG